MHVFWHICNSKVSNTTTHATRQQKDCSSPPNLKYPEEFSIAMISDISNQSLPGVSSKGK